MPTVLHWFRQDLRLSDNPALSKAARSGDVFPIYISNSSTDVRPLGEATKAWLHHSLLTLNASLGGALGCYLGDPKSIITSIVQDVRPSAVYWNRSYEPEQVALDKEIEATLADLGVKVVCCHESLLWEPETTLKADGTPYKVFTPFYKKGCLAGSPPRACYEVPNLEHFKQPPGALTVEGLNLLPQKKWWLSMMDHWEVGEEAAQKRLHEFIENGLEGYKEGRNHPTKPHVSRLSPYLHFGEISPHQIWWATEGIVGKDVEHFRSEVGWREFSYSLLHHFPNLNTDNFNSKYDAFPWQDNEAWLKAWQKGQTGVPIVDAGMRELWQTGYMHNRVRMIVASYLVKNLNIHWRHGEAWFWDCLVDADLANNSASWQWVAGSGADAAPYFRVFNPVMQGHKFDAEGGYTRHYLPELKDLPTKYLFSPWEAPQDVLDKAGVVLGKTYPKPLVDLKASRLRALENFASLKTQ
jgi:deoxyribodipyrimidine photo-lyase